MDCLLQQTYRDYEVLVLDDASTDDSAQVLREYVGGGRVRAILRLHNSGCVFRQWNAGVALVRGEYVWIAESDDYADERFLEEMVAVLDAHPEVGLVKCRSTIVDEVDRPTPDSVEHPASRDWSCDFVIPGPDDCRLQLVHGNSAVNASAVLFRRRLYREVGGADESFRMCADWLQWAKMMLKMDFAYVARPLNYYRRHAGTVRHHCLGNVIHDLEDLRVCAYLLKRLPVSAEVREGVCDRLVERWVRHSLSRRRIPDALGYDLRMLGLLRQVDRRYAGRILKHAARRLFEKCAPGMCPPPATAS
jgi:glycosyltransferase involved in cell wall biosynthesis